VEDDVTGHLAEWGLKALAGGLLVVAFALAAQVVSPKRLSGILSAAPSVALGAALVAWFAVALLLLAVVPE
jgi:hypothetical protein